MTAPLSYSGNQYSNTGFHCQVRGKGSITSICYPIPQHRMGASDKDVQLQPGQTAWFQQNWNGSHGRSEYMHRERRLLEYLETLSLKIRNFLLNSFKISILQLWTKDQPKEICPLLSTKIESSTVKMAQLVKEITAETWWLGLYSQKSHEGKRQETTLQNYSLASTCLSWHKHPHMHTIII